MQLQTHGARTYPTSALLESSAGLGWSTYASDDCPVHGGVSCARAGPGADRPRGTRAMSAGDHLVAVKIPL